jgi:cell shape-determining protein MreC
VQTKRGVELKVMPEEVLKEPKRTFMITYVVEFLDGRKSFKTIYVSRKGKLNVQFFEELRLKLLSEEGKKWKKTLDSSETEELEKHKRAKISWAIPLDIAIIFVKELEE